MIIPHYKQTAQRIQGSDAEYILAIQDQMRLNFTKHKAKTDLGATEKSGKMIQYGLIQHSVLSVTNRNEPVSLDISYFDYDDIDTSTSRDKQVIEDKANKFWTDALKKGRKLRERLKHTPILGR